VGGNEVIPRVDPEYISGLLLDTHALVWLMNDNPKLGPKAKDVIRRAYRQKCAWISAITSWEIALLVGKNRLNLGKDVLVWIREALKVPGVQLAPLDPEIAVASIRFPFEMHGDPADRILVATARHLGATLVTADSALLELAKQRYFVGMDAGV
jgi:PIN domain nuclease of toxin-antitoxin system